jgi:hypothetical protein
MSFKIICNSSLDKLHEFDEFAKKYSGFLLPHIIFVAKVNVMFHP